jgi:solute carrier family 25 protein 39/40
MEEALARGMSRMGGSGGGTLVLPQPVGAGALERVMGGFWGEVATVHRETGIKGLWKGVGTTM